MYYQKTNNMKNLILITLFSLVLFTNNAKAQLFPEKIENIATKLSDANVPTYATNGVFVAGGLLIVYDLVTPNKEGCQTKKRPSKYRKGINKNRKKITRRNRRRRK